MKLFVVMESLIALSEELKRCKVKNNFSSLVVHNSDFCSFNFSQMKESRRLFFMSRSFRIVFSFLFTTFRLSLLAHFSMWDCTIYINLLLADLDDVVGFKKLWCNCGFYIEMFSTEFLLNINNALWNPSSLEAPSHIGYANEFSF